MERGKGCKNLLCITLGTGVGGGIILNNELYRGEGFAAGEIGHFPYQDSVFEHYVGNKTLVKKARKIFKAKKISIEDVFAEARQGNKKALRFWQEAGEDIGTMMTGYVNLMNPRLIIIGGGVSNNFRFLKDAIYQTIQKRAMKVQKRMVKVVRAKLGDDAGIIGAQVLVKDAIIGH